MALNPFRILKREFYFRRAYNKFENGAEIARKENAFSPRETEASKHVGEAIQIVDKALEDEPYEITDFEAGMHFAALTDEDCRPIEYEEFKEYFEQLDQL